MRFLIYSRPARALADAVVSRRPEDLSSWIFGFASFGAWAAFLAGLSVDGSVIVMLVCLGGLLVALFLCSLCVAGLLVYIGALTEMVVDLQDAAAAEQPARGEDES